MAVDLPSVVAEGDVLTLGELRELVESAAGLPDETEVRGSGTPFALDFGAMLKGIAPPLAKVSLTRPPEK